MSKHNAYRPVHVELYRSKRPAWYWPVFFLVSFLVHYAAYGMLHEPLREFVDKLPGKKLIIDKIVQVQLVTVGEETAAITVPEEEPEPVQAPAVMPEPPREPRNLAERQPAEPPTARPAVARPEPAREPAENTEKKAFKAVPPAKAPPAVKQPSASVRPAEIPKSDIDDIKVVDAFNRPIENRAVKVAPLEPLLDREPDDSVMVIKGKETTRVVPKAPEPAEEPVKLAETRVHDAEKAHVDEIPPPEHSKPVFGMITSVTKPLLPSEIKEEVIAKASIPLKQDSAVGSPERRAVPNTAVASRVYEPGRPVKDVASLDIGQGLGGVFSPEPMHDASITPSAPFTESPAPPAMRLPEPTELRGKVPIKLSLTKPGTIQGHSLTAPKNTRKTEGKPKAALVLVVELPEVPLPPPRVTIETPATDRTDTSIAAVSGSAAGPGVNSVVVSLGETKKELLLEGGHFSVDVPLSEGMNVISATVEDSSGRIARDRKVLYYEPSAVGPYIVIAKPQSNGAVDMRMTGEVEVLGYVEGDLIEEVALHLNSGTRYAPVEEGVFRAMLPVSAEHNVLYAEATDSFGNTSRSQKVEFRALNVYPKDIVVLINYEGNTGGVSLTHSWRPHPLSQEKADRESRPEFTRESVRDGTVVEIEHAVPGVYTVGVGYNIPAENGPVTATFTVIIHGKDPEMRKDRVIGPVELSGSGKLQAVRLLMPEAVFWEDDNWFSGKIETSRETTKFRQPEGIIWREED